MTVWRTEPFAAGSTSPGWRALRGTSRLTAFSWRTWYAALRRSSVAECSSIFSSSSVSDVSVFLKSNRWWISREAWSTALRTSCRSTSETMSNELWAMAAG